MIILRLVDFFFKKSKRSLCIVRMQYIFRHHFKKAGGTNNDISNNFNTYICDSLKKLENIELDEGGVKTGISI